jgi:hypothetical protein
MAKARPPATADASAFTPVLAVMASIAANAAAADAVGERRQQHQSRARDGDQNIRMHQRKRSHARRIRRRPGTLVLFAVETHQKTHRQRDGEAGCMGIPKS